MAGEIPDNDDLDNMLGGRNNGDKEKPVVDDGTTEN